MLAGVQQSKHLSELPVDPGPSPTLHRAGSLTHHTFADPAPLAPTPALRTQGVELVEENNAGGGSPRPQENLTDGLLRFPDVLVQKLWAYFF